MPAAPIAASSAGRRTRRSWSARRTRRRSGTSAWADFEGGVILRNILKPEYLLEHDLVLIGSPETVATKLKSFAAGGHFNTFMGEFNFGELSEPDLMRSSASSASTSCPRSGLGTVLMRAL